VGKYRVGQHVKGLGGGTIKGVVVEIIPNVPGAVGGPGTLVVEDRDHRQEVENMIGKLRVKLEPAVIERGLEWDDVLPNLQEAQSVAALRVAMQEGGSVERFLDANAKERERNNVNNQDDDLLEWPRGAANKEAVDQSIEFGILSTNPIATSSVTKYTEAGQLKTGQPADAALGLPHFMGIDSRRVGEIISQGLGAIRAEFMEHGSAEEIVIMQYILDQAAKEEQETVSYGRVVRDKGHSGMRLVDFQQLRDAKTARLEAAHVAALRIYTSQAYKRMNKPLRNGCSEANPHPFAATTYFVSEALKKLRSVNASKTNVQERKEFWRGMKVSDSVHTPSCIGCISI
jgi:hypothetical protein